MMDFRQASPRKEAAKTTKKRTSTGNTETQGQIKFTANPVARQRSLQQIQKETEEFDNSAWGDSDEDGEYNPKDPIQNDGDATDVDEDIPLKDAKRRKTAPGTSTSGAKSRGAPAKAMEVVDLASASDINRADASTPNTEGYKALQVMYKKVSMAVTIDGPRGEITHSLEADRR